MVLFVGLVYTKYWNDCHLGNWAPYNDPQFLHLLKMYPNIDIGKKAFTAFSKHLWVFPEHLVPMKMKQHMTKNRTRPKLLTFSRRLQLAKDQDLSLEAFFTERTISFFDAAVRNVYMKAQAFCIF